MAALTLEVTIAGTPDRCFALLTQPADGALDACDAQPGGSWRASEHSGTVTIATAPSALVLACADDSVDAVTFHLQRVGLKATRVRLTIDSPAEIGRAAPALWREHLGRLKSLAETGRPDDAQAREAITIGGSTRPHGPPSVDGGV